MSSETVVVGVDGSDTARAAAERAASVAMALGVRLHLVSAVKSSPVTVVDGPGSDSWVLDDAGVVEGQLRDLAATWPDLECSVAGVTGKPADVLIAEAERLDATLIVVGNRRMQGIGRVLGAVANDVAHHAPCDVYIVKTVG